jgi:VanZ family protein
MVKWVPVIFWAIIIFIASTLPSSSFNSIDRFSFSGIDHWGHLLFYSILSFWAIFGKKGFDDLFSWSRLKDGILIILVISYGILIELIQNFFFTDRHFEILDIIANIIGSILGVFLFNFLLKNYNHVKHSN